MNLSPNAIQYTWRQFALRLGVSPTGTDTSGFQTLGIPVQYAPLAQADRRTPGIIVVPCADSAWDDLLTRPPHSLDWLPPDRVFAPGDTWPDSIPVLLWGQGYEHGQNPFAALADDGSVIFYADILAAALLMLTRWEETIIAERDTHDRFPASASVAYRQGFLNRPVVDEYARILGSWLEHLLPVWTMPRPTLQIALSHDVDHPVRWLTPRKVLSDVYVCMRDQYSPFNAGHTLFRGVQVLLNETYQHDPYFRALETLANVSEKHNLKSSFYFMGSTGGPFDSGYNPCQTPTKDFIQAIIARGHEAGFHPGYETYLNPARFQAEKQRITEAIGSQPTGGRQHYLRFRVPDTWRIWEASGMQYDSTLSYADHEGFRGGTCFDYPPYDLEQDRQMNLIERPLIVMEGSLEHYRGLDVVQAEKSIHDLATKCHWVGGRFTLLWHNSSIHHYPNTWTEMYLRVVSWLTTLQD